MARGGDQSMGDCKFCGEKAGLFKKEHKDCLIRHQSGWQEILSVAHSAVLRETEKDHVLKNIWAISQDSFHNFEEDASGLVQALRSGWDKALNDALEDSILDDDEERALDSFLDKFDICVFRSKVNAHFGRK